jgi:hypothetical protein
LNKICAIIDFVQIADLMRIHNLTCSAVSRPKGGAYDRFGQPQGTVHGMRAVTTLSLRAAGSRFPNGWNRRAGNDNGAATVEVTAPLDRAAFPPSAAAGNTVCQYDRPRGAPWHIQRHVARKAMAAHGGATSAG